MKENKGVKLTVLYVILGVVFVVWVGFAFLDKYWLKDVMTKDWAVTGQFGDSFAILNTLFAGLAFAALFYAIRQQNHALEMQREDLKLQRELLTQEIEEAKLARKEWEKTAKAQAELVKLSALSALVNYYGDELNRRHVISNADLTSRYRGRKEDLALELEQTYIENAGKKVVPIPEWLNEEIRKSNALKYWNADAQTPS